MNPFIFSGASNLKNQQILDMFVHDHNYSRFIQSKRNVFLWGDRGSGKTMTLLYNKIVMNKTIEEAAKSDCLIEFIPVYVSCITPLVFKREHLLLENKFKASVISEHYFALSVALSLVKALLDVPVVLKGVNQNEASIELGYLFDKELPPGDNLLIQLRFYLNREFIQTQKEINRPDSDSFYSDTYTFTSLVLPIMEFFKSWPMLKESHFIFMMDDAHDLNLFQRAALNSWIAYRDNSYFSFKVSAARVSDYDLNTTSGGAILEGHDYVSVDLEQPFQNDHSAYGKMAEKIISKRLEIASIDSTPKSFFPMSKIMENDLEECRKKTLSAAQQKFTSGTSKQINDYAYKYTRAMYFRERSSKANRPPYSGFETIVHLSSGVIRNLLEPCYIMYEDAISECSDVKKINYIKPTIQADVILRLSDRQWERLRNGIDQEITECSKEQAKSLENLFNALAELFRKKLLYSDHSEPRSITFTISNKEEQIMAEIMPILNIARRAQLLYKRTGSAKDRGEREDYYVPNRMLWPARGLDPVGQHARTPIQAKFILGAIRGESIPFQDTKTPGGSQGDLFDE